MRLIIGTIIVFACVFGGDAGMGGKRDEDLHMAAKRGGCD